MTAITTLGLLTPCALSSREKGEELLRLLQNTGVDLAPRRYDVSEPIRRVFNPARIDEALMLWGGPRFFWTTVMQGGTGLYFEGVSRGTLDTIIISVENDLVDPTTFIDRMNALTRAFQAEFAYVHKTFDEDLNDREHYKNRIMPFCQGLSAPQFEQKLPGVAWAMWFGGSYLQRLDRKRLLSAPVYSARELDEGVFLQVTERLHSYADAEPFRRTSDTLIGYLGSEVVRS